MQADALPSCDAGRRTRLLYGNSSYASYVYDDANHLTLISNRQSDDDVISSFAYTVDKTGNRTRLTLANGDYADYLYDDTYQLTREHREDSSNDTLYYNNFYYDAAGNRTRLEYNDGVDTTTTTYLYNEADQLTKETQGQTVTTYLYNANGNLTKKDDGTNVHAYSYDFRNLMTQYDGPGSGNDATYSYDAAGRRMEKVVGGSTTTKYYHDQLNVVAEYNGNDQLLRTYVTPGLDANLSLTASANTYYYLRDALGSVRQLLDSSETTQNNYDYFAFGKTYGSPTENVAQPFRFTGRAWDPESDLYYYRARNYAPNVGRFVARDAAKTETNSYLYCLANPASRFDPLGLESEYPWGDDERRPSQETVETFFSDTNELKDRAKKVWNAWNPLNSERGWAWRQAGKSTPVKRTIKPQCGKCEASVYVMKKDERTGDILAEWYGDSRIGSMARPARRVITYTYVCVRKPYKCGSWEKSESWGLSPPRRYYTGWPIDKTNTWYRVFFKQVIVEARRCWNKCKPKPKPKPHLPLQEPQSVAPYPGGKWDPVTGSMPAD